MFKKTIVTLIAVVSVTSCAKKQPTFENILQAQLQRYPAMQIEDWYKLVYQAALGNEHLMTDSAAVQTYLIHELASIDSASIEPLLENISPDGEVVRLNLRPFKARQGDHDVLFRAMLQTARTFQKSPEHLAMYWHALEQLAQSGAIAFDAAAMHAFFQEMREKNFPAVHHSKIYEEKYKPAYRVILRKYAPRL